MKPSHTPHGRDEPIVIKVLEKLKTEAVMSKFATARECESYRSAIDDMLLMLRDTPTAAFLSHPNLNIDDLQAWPPTKEENQRRFAMPEDLIWLLQTTLGYYASFDTWHGERTGGVLEGCPRGSPSIHKDRGRYAGQAYKRLSESYPLKEIK